jgi:hypothetical protein
MKQKNSELFGVHFGFFEERIGILTQIQSGLEPSPVKDFYTENGEKFWRKLTLKSR